MLRRISPVKNQKRFHRPTDWLKSSTIPWRSPIRHGSMLWLSGSIQLSSLSKKTMITMLDKHGIT
ncbi:hypothetical protein DY000_02041925 [Brassica cretica]|uniref:Uncharacterized protein n=1 Tax=Brassica cretica TaxID=69181 RepID=A0ABQ7BL21_BRACR|nr:hypothetical protein DY000_02041925 [Brassica cretica]